MLWITVWQQYRRLFGQRKLYGWQGGKQTGVPATIPVSLTPGKYLLRTEVVFFYRASPEYNEPGGYQLYHNCAQLDVTGGGSKLPTDGLVAFPGAYQPDDKGFVFYETFPKVWWNCLYYLRWKMYWQSYIALRFPRSEGVDRAVSLGEFGADITIFEGTLLIFIILLRLLRHRPHVLSFFCCLQSCQPRMGEDLHIFLAYSHSTTYMNSHKPHIP